MKALKSIALLLFVLVGLLYAVAFWYLRNPSMGIGSSVQIKHRADASRLKTHVEFLSGIVPNRSYQNADSMFRAERYISDYLTSLGYKVSLQEVYEDKTVYHNVIVRLGAETGPLVVIGAHYDVAEEDNPGADDNASGVAGLLELARLLKENEPELKSPVELVAYTLEEPPYFATFGMGSVYHADQIKERGEEVKLMLSLEMIGYYSDEWFSQKFPIPLLYALYPWRGNFISLVASPSERKEVRMVKDSFSSIEGLKTYSINAPTILPGIDYSDHRSYWEHEWPAIMVSDTAFYRNLEYHKPGDTAGRLDFEKMKLVVEALYTTVVNVP
ncbi:MAG: M28 family peptidase [Bdellovibrionaceae bacterium]|nr:M28 family peptidase [Bdellovibrionales bacterium]MCB9083690.1 M28 family peptidase [Pseudobdellovibrionaceae bacterium]